MDGPQDGLSAEYRSFLDRQRNPTPEPAPSVPSFTTPTERETKQRAKSAFEQAMAEQAEAPSASAFSSSIGSKTPSETDNLGQTDEQSEQETESGAVSLPVRQVLPMPVKRRIVELFATFHGVASVVATIDAEFGVKLAKGTASHYDCSRRACRISPRLRSLYDDTRQHYINSAGDVAIAHQAKRLRLIGQLVEKATNSKDYAAALKGLELAAKEMGGVLEGKQTVTHQGAVTHVHGTVDDMRLELGMRLQGIVDGGTLLPAPVTPAPCGKECGESEGN